MLADELRRTVLQSAISGKLTERLSSDSSVDELISNIAKEKARLIKEKTIKKSKPLDPISEDEIPFDIPKGWRWIKIGNIGAYKKGPFGSSLTKSIFLPKSENTIKVYEQKNAIKKDITLGSYYISDEYFLSKMKGFEVFSGDIIVSCAGTIGETYKLPDIIERGIINQALMIIRLSSFINENYFLQYFDFILKQQSALQSNGSAIKNIPPFSIFKNMLIPLPSIEEQERIVENIESTLIKIDEFENTEIQLNLLIKQFPKDLKASLLQSGIKGDLTEQLSSDSSVDELISNIAKEKARLIKEKTIKKSKPLAPLNEDEIPYDIPKTWRWVRLEEVCKITMGQSPKGDDINQNKNGVEFHQGKIFFSSMYIDKSSNFTRFAKKYVEKDSILMCVRAPVGNVNITDRTICIGRGLCGVRPCFGITTLFIYYLLLSYKEYFEKRATGSTFKAITINTVKLAPIPLPPIEEQQRIVDKLENALAMCDNFVEK